MGSVFSAFWAWQKSHFRVQFFGHNHPFPSSNPQKTTQKSRHYTTLYDTMFHSFVWKYATARGPKTPLALVCFVRLASCNPPPPPKQAIWFLVCPCPIWLDDRGTGQWKWMEEVPRRASLVPLSFPCFLHCLIGVETGGLLDYQGRAGGGGGHFHFTVEPSPGHTRCRVWLPSEIPWMPLRWCLQKQLSEGSSEPPNLARFRFLVLSSPAPHLALPGPKGPFALAKINLLLADAAIWRFPSPISFSLVLGREVEVLPTVLGSGKLGGAIRANRTIRAIRGQKRLTRYKNRGVNCEWFVRINSRDSRCESLVSLRWKELNGSKCDSRLKNDLRMAPESLWVNFGHLVSSSQSHFG